MPDATSTPSGIEPIKEPEIHFPDDKKIEPEKKDKVELKNKRTLNAKHFQKENGEFVMDAHAGHIHYFDKLDSKRFREIDHKLSFDEKRNGWTFKYHSFHPLFPKYSTDFAEFRDLFDDKDQTIKYKAIGEKVEGTLIETDETNPNFDDNKDNKAVLYKDTFGKGKDYILYNTRSSMVKVATVNNPNEQKEDVVFEWEVEMPKVNAKELPIYRTESKEKLVAELKDKFLTAYKLDTTREKVFDTNKLTLIGEDKNDGKEWFTYLKGYKAWDTGDEDGNTTITVEAKLYKKGNKLILRKTIPLSFLQKAKGRVFTDTTTSYYAGAGDGYVGHENTSGSWSTVHDATSGTIVDYTSITPLTRSFWDGGEFFIDRTFFPIDTSTIPDSASISGANLNIYISRSSISTQCSINSGYITVIETSQASNTLLVVDDYDNIGIIEGIDSGERFTLCDGTTGAKSFSLNSTGIGWISKTSYTNLGMRESHDITNTAVAQNSNHDNLFIESSSSEETGTDQDPYLSVTYTEVAVSTFTPKVMIY